MNGGCAASVIWHEKTLLKQWRVGLIVNLFNLFQPYLNIPV